MRVLMVAILTALLFPLSTGSNDGGNLVNAVLGNVSRSSANSDETTRIREHLFGVVERLSEVDARGLTPELRCARARNLERLVQYANAGHFPHNPAGIPDRIPNFLDGDGARCAVGYLVEQDLGLGAVEEIAREHQFDYVPYIDSPVLAAWQQGSGLTPLELAMIQPTYDYPKPPGQVAPPPRVDPPKPEDVLRVRIDARMLDLELVGFAGQVVVAKNRGVVIAQGYGFEDVKRRVPVERETGFDIASVTKAFTAAAIFALMDNEKVKLDDTLGGLLPGAPADKRRITVEQLLGHTSGMGNTYAADGEQDRATAVAKLLAQPMENAPGGKFRYSDDGYVILAAIVEIASDMSYESYLEENVMNRGHMAHTAFWGDSRARVAELSRPLGASLTRPQWGQRGSGGIISTADDLYGWSTAFLDGQVVSNDAVTELTKPRQRLESGVDAGYGWFWTGSEGGPSVLWTRGNEDFGHNALVAIYREHDLTLVVTSNRFIGEEPWSRRVQSELEPLLIGQ